jgi:hypothetical protein
VALGPGFAPFAGPVYKHTHHLIHSLLLQDRHYRQGEIQDPPEKEFLVAALDLMSGLVQGLGEDLFPVLNGTDPKLVEMLTHCLTVWPCLGARPLTHGRTKLTMCVNLDSRYSGTWPSTISRF